MSKIISKSTATRIAEVCVYCEQELGFNPLSLYCSITGRPIGKLDESIMVDILLEADVQDLDELAEDLLFRTLSSSRPSPSWNMIDRHSLTLYSETRPVETLTYLLSRLYESSPNLKADLMTRIKGYHLRLQIYALLDSLQNRGADFSELMLLLIEIDALYNLSKLPVPRNDILLTLTLAVDCFDSDKEAWEQFMADWREWHGELFEQYERRLKQALSQDSWLKGNSTVTAARTKILRDSKPKSEATIKREQKKRVENELVNMLSAIINSEDTAQVKPEPKPVQGLIRPGQLKLSGLKIIGGK